MIVERTLVRTEGLDQMCGHERRRIIGLLHARSLLRTAVNDRILHKFYLIVDCNAKNEKPIS